MRNGPGYCQSGTKHLNDYFAGACDGASGKAKAGADGTCDAAKPVAKKAETNTNLGTLRVDLLPHIEGRDLVVIRLHQTPESVAAAFIEEIVSKSAAIRGWERVTANNGVGGIISVQVNRVYSATFNSPVG